MSILNAIQSKRKISWHLIVTVLDFQPILQKLTFLHHCIDNNKPSITWRNFEMYFLIEIPELLPNDTGTSINSLCVCFASWITKKKGQQQKDNTVEI